MKTHVNWIVSAAILALSLEGLMGTVGESLAHAIGMNKQQVGVLGATLLGWVWSCLYDSHETKTPSHKPRRAKRPPKSR
jgi:hypothetical protein